MTLDSLSAGTRRRLGIGVVFAMLAVVLAIAVAVMASLRESANRAFEQTAAFEQVASGAQSGSSAMALPAGHATIASWVWPVLGLGVVAVVAGTAIGWRIARPLLHCPKRGTEEDGVAS